MCKGYKVATTTINYVQSRKGRYNFRFDQILKLRKLAETLKRIWHVIYWILTDESKNVFIILMFSVFSRMFTLGKKAMRFIQDFF